MRADNTLLHFEGSPIEIQAEEWALQPILRLRNGSPAFDLPHQCLTSARRGHDGATNGRTRLATDHLGFPAMDGGRV